MTTVVSDTRLLPTYPETKVGFVEGDGVWLTGADGRRYLDFAAGIAVVSLGHRHPAPLAAAHAQLERLWHASNLFATEPAAELASALSARFGGAQAFFCNSGTEANEAAIKYARKATGKPGVLALEGSFHGRTLGALAVTGQAAKRSPFEPLGPVRFAKPNDISTLYEVDDEDVGLVLLEPVLGEGGVVPLDPAFVAAAAARAKGLGALLAFDEVQTGVGRTGTFFAFDQLGVRPELLASVRANGDRLLDGLEQLPGVAEARGAGLLVGAVLDRPAGEIVDAALDAGLVCLTAGPNVLRLAPPLVVGADEIDHALSILTEVLA